MVFACAAMISACQKEDLSTNATAATPSSSFVKKQLAIDDVNGKAVLIEVGASDINLLDQLQASQFTVELGMPTADAPETAHAPHEKSNPTTVIPQRYVTVKVLGGYTNAEIEGYTLSFSKALQDLLRREKAGMRIALQPSDVTPPIATRTSGWWYRTPYCSKVICYGDGGQIPTGVTTYRPTSVGQSAVHAFTFFNSASCTRCAHGINAIDDIWVWQDVLRSVGVYGYC